LINTDTKIIQ